MRQLVQKGDVLEFRMGGEEPRQVRVLGVEVLHPTFPPEPGTRQLGILLPRDASKESLVDREAWLLQASETKE